MVADPAGLELKLPVWHGADTGYASYRYQVWSRWPIAGPTDLFGSAAAYDRHSQVLLATQVPLDAAMLYFDARLCEKHPAVEVRVADVCPGSTPAAVIAVLVRALFETAARQWRAGDPAPEVPASVLRAWSWMATGVPAGDVIAQLLDTVRSVLGKYQEDEQVETVVTDILRNGTGARHLRQVYATGHDLRDVVAAALEGTHHTPVVWSTGTVVAESSIGTAMKTTEEMGEGIPEETPTVV